MNTLCYLIYFLITYFITVHVGLILYHNGKVFILNLLQGDERLTNFVNRVLLAGYYLLNLGYVALSINLWKTITTWTDALTSISIMTGKILFLLAVIHYFNIVAILFISRKHHTANNKI